MNKKYFIFGCLLTICLIFLVVAGSITFIAIKANEVIQENIKKDEEVAKAYEKKKIDVQATKVDSADNSIELENSKSDFTKGQTIRVADLYTIKVTLESEITVDNSVAGYDDGYYKLSGWDDPYKGTYGIFLIEINNISDQQITTPIVSIYNSDTGITDSVGSIADIQKVLYSSYVEVDAGKKYSGYLQVKLNNIQRESLSLKVVDQTIDIDLPEIKNFYIKLY